MNEFRIGRHINISKGFVTAPWYAQSLGCSVFQIFLGAPRRILSKARQKEELQACGQELDKRNLKMVIHGSYTINLCHPPGSKKFEASVKSLVQDLDASIHIGDNCMGVIIHMGKNIPDNKISDSEAINNYVLGLRQAMTLTPENTVIILETGASQGAEVGSEMSGLSTIYRKLSKGERARIMFCIDTCHIWATGYDISSPIGVKKFFAEFDKKIGIDKIACIHFNDSKTALNSCVDRHADIGYGFIDIKGLKEIVLFAKKNKIPLITETPLDAIDPETNQEVTFDKEFSKIKSWIK